MALFNKMKSYLPYKNLTDTNITDKWTESTGTSEEFYYSLSEGYVNGAYVPVLKQEPMDVFLFGEKMTKGTLGELDYREWAWGEDDAQHFFCLYVRTIPITWVVSHFYEVDKIRKSSAGDFYKCTVEGVSGTAEPTWDTVEGNITTEGAPDPLTHAGHHQYLLNDVIKSSAGDYYKVVTSGEAGSSEPAWNTTVGETTQDNEVTWERIDTPAANVQWERIENTTVGDPDNYADNVIQCQDFIEVFQASDSKETIALSVIIANVGDNDSNIIFLITDEDHHPLFTMMITLLSTDGPLTMPEKIVVPALGRIKIMSSEQLVSVSITEDES